MTFGEKLRVLREKAGLSQDKLAAALDLSKHSIMNYEVGRSYPILNKMPAIAKFFGVTLDSLMSEEETFVAKAYEDGGSRGAKEAEALIADATGLFAGGRITEDEKEAVFRALQNAYWIARDAAKKKYTPKKYRKDAETE
ncbi:hypothetical protein FACS18945_4920 [Bacteroidia bacterium]|nr:hypothetical protein FACS18945_4920 [Bacteroidia bacterium]